MRVIYCSILLIASLALGGCNQGFSDADIVAAKKSIKEEFEKNAGLTVSDVTLIKESSNKLTGFMKGRYMGHDIMKSCSATMAESGGTYLWKCE